MTSIQLSAEMLPLPEDRLISLTEAADILGEVGSTRKRVLLMWQAVELSRYFKFPDARTLDVARRALRPAAISPDDWGHLAAHAASDTSAVASWRLVRAGCLEATLGLAIYAKHHADVFDTAAALLREHATELSSHRMQSLLDNMLAASSQMTPAEKKLRHGAGPPPLLHAPRALELSPDRRPRAANDRGPTSPAGDDGSVFLYDPYSERRRKDERVQSSRGSDRHGNASHDDGPRAWVVGELGALEVEVSNPTSIGIKVRRLER